MDLKSFFRVVCFPLLIAGLTLSPDQCSRHQSTNLRNTATSFVEEVDDLLVPSVFKKVVRGYFLTVVNEENGINDGGSTNTFGSYGSFVIPNGTDLFPVGMCELQGPNPKPICNSTDNSTVNFILGPADVIAFYACTPPPMKYFSYDMVITERITEEYPFYPGINFGDAISFRTINVTNKDTSVFDQPAVVIHSSDAAAARKVGQAFENLSGGNITARDITIRGIASNNPVRLWDRSGGQPWQVSQPDILAFIARVSVPLGGENDTAYEAYKATIWPVRFYLADDEARAQEPMNPPIAPRYTESVVNEQTTLTPYLSGLADGVVQSYLNTKNGTGVTSIDLTTDSVGCYDDWDAVLAAKNNATFVVGTRDATYGTPIFPPDISGFLLQPNTAAVIIGVQHTSVIGAAYSSVGLDLQSLSSGDVLETHWFLDTDMIGSARRYLPADTPVEIADSFYAIDMLPHGGCASVPEDEAKWCFEFGPWTQATVALKRPVLIAGERIYSLAATTVGPAANETLTSHVLVFRLNT